MTRRDPRLLELERQIGKLVQEYCETNEDDFAGPIITHWAIGYEFASVELEEEHQAGRGVCVPDGQAVSASVGLGVLIQQAFAIQP